MKDVNENKTWQWDEGPIGRLVKISSITLRREMEQLLRPLDLTLTQWSALGILLHYPGIAPSQLEQILMIERPSVTSLMNGMAEKGWIIRKDHPQDRRFKLIYLTEEGVKLAEETRDYALLVEQRVREGMTPTEFETLKELLVKMVKIFD